MASGDWRQGGRLQDRTELEQSLNAELAELTSGRRHLLSLEKALNDCLRDKTTKQSGNSSRVYRYGPQGRVASTSVNTRKKKLVKRRKVTSPVTEEGKM